MPKYGMLIDNTRCVGCFACQVACQNQWQLPVNEKFIKMETLEQGSYPNVTIENFTTQCNHCDDAPCAAVCPVDAVYTDKNGTVLNDEKKCIRCGACVDGCPYNARIWSEKFGMPEKCFFCAEFVAVGETPQCVSTCIAKARVFGDLSDPASDISKTISKTKAQPLAGKDGAKPKIYYNRPIKSGKA